MVLSPSSSAIVFDQQPRNAVVHQSIDRGTISDWDYYYYLSNVDREASLDLRS